MNCGSMEVVLDGERIDNLDENDFVDIRRNRIAYVFQQSHLLSSLTAIENVMLPLLFCGSCENSYDKAMNLFWFCVLNSLIKKLNPKPNTKAYFTKLRNAPCIPWRRWSIMAAICRRVRRACSKRHAYCFEDFLRSVSTNRSLK